MLIEVSAKEAMLCSICRAPFRSLFIEHVPRETRTRERLTRPEFYKQTGGQEESGCSTRLGAVNIFIASLILIISLALTWPLAKGQSDLKTNLPTVIVRGFLVSNWLS